MTNLLGVDEHGNEVCLHHTTHHTVIIDECNPAPINIVAYSKRIWHEKWNLMLLGKFKEAFSKPFSIKQYCSSLQTFIASSARYRYVSKHLAHAATGFQLSVFTEATVIVLSEGNAYITAHILVAKSDENGVVSYKKKLKKSYYLISKHEVIAAVCKYAEVRKYSPNLVICGDIDVCDNINTLIPEYFDKIWLSPIPNDRAIATGAALYLIKEQTGVETCIYDRRLSPETMNSILLNLTHGGIVDIPQDKQMLIGPVGNIDKVKAVNKVTVILEEHAARFFKTPIRFVSSEFTAIPSECKLPRLYPMVINDNNCSRVKIIPKSSSSYIRKVLEEWYAKTGYPMLVSVPLEVKDIK